MLKKDLGGDDSNKDKPEVKLSAEEKDLLELAEGLDQQQDEGNNNEDGFNEDDKDDWVDKLDELSAEEHEEHKLYIHFISHVLVKV